MTNLLPLHLQKNEQSAVWLLADHLQDFLGDDLCHLWLFGSKARGDFTVDSDVDVLIVLHNLDSERRGAIRRMAARVSLNFDTLINTHIIDKARWDHLAQHQDTLWREVQRDGISLDDLATQPAT
jgi:predicted nucleotidyltransferase